MKLTETEREMFREQGYSDQNIDQIERALQRSKTTYFMGATGVSREEAINLLGRETFLSGIARSAFHCTATRKTKNGKVVYFNSTNLFKDN